MGGKTCKTLQSISLLNLVLDKCTYKFLFLIYFRQKAFIFGWNTVNVFTTLHNVTKQNIVVNIYSLNCNYFKQKLFNFLLLCDIYFNT